VSNFVESFRDTGKVSRVETGNGDSTVQGHIDGVIVFELLNLGGVKTSISEHTNL